jgi:DNA replication and repair protein RecF
MYLKALKLVNFRSYDKTEIKFNPKTTIIIGPNTFGKTNLVESIYLLSTGKSFRAEKDIQMIKFGEDVARVVGEIGETKLEAVLSTGQANGKNSFLKKLLVNGISKRRVDFAANLSVVLFSPEDLDIIVDSPGLRRRFLDDVLEQVDREYRLALISYTKSLRQRNALLERTREEGIKNERQFDYWNNILIENGSKITEKREKFIEFANTEEKELFDFIMYYDKSVVSHQRLLQYEKEEVAAGVTLVGPHRDDFSLSMFDNQRQTTHDIKLFGSRGQQRLAILQLKLLELLYIEKILGYRPVLVLDDIFSEFDEEHINLVLEIVGKQQTIITTTHKEFIPKKILAKMQIVELKNEKL